MKKLISALLDNEADAVRPAALRLFAVGATSGADLATGLVMTLLDRNLMADWGQPRMLDPL